MTTIDELLNPVHASWLPLLDELRPELERVVDALELDADAGLEVLPARSVMLRALATALSDVRVLIIGQDPYPTPGHPVGLSFVVASGVAMPRSLRNIAKEVASDLGRSSVLSEDLESWRAQGVMLLNRSLSVRAGDANSHAKIGWGAITDAVVTALNEREQPLVAILWGANAQTLEPRLDRATVIKSAHPSPLSASRGFFGSRPFSRANEALLAAGAEPIEW